MKCRVILSPDAKEHIRSAIRWYSHQDFDLSLRFNAERHGVFGRIARNPYQFPVTHNLMRRALMKRFPYAIYFNVDADAVLIVAVLHQRRLNPWHKPR